MCWGTRLGMCDKTSDRINPDALSTWQAFARVWLRHYSEPEILVCDQGVEFQKEFGLGCEERGIFMQVTNVEAPWERDHGEGQQDFQAAVPCR